MSFYHNESKCVWFWDYIIPFTRFWGIFTSVVMCGVGVDLFVHHHLMGLYIVFAAFLVLFLEVTWVITLFLKVCVSSENSRIFNYWNAILWIDRWKKTLVYFSFSAALILKPHRLWLSSVAGAMLTILGSLYLILCFGSESRESKKESLLKNQEDYCERYGEIFEVLDNTVVPKEEPVLDEPGGNVLEI